MTKYVDEHNIFEKLLKFHEFQLFYEDEWKPRERNGSSINWLIDPSIEHYAMQDKDPATGKDFIVLKHLPETQDDAFLVAHEMMHVIISFDNQDLRFQINNKIARNYEGDSILNMVRKLASMLDDPRVDSFLLNKYNFNLSHFYANIKLPDAIKHLIPASEGKFDLYRWNQAMFYSQTKLQCDLAKDEEVAHKWTELEKLYQENRPNVKKIGDELYAMMKENGYDTVGKQKTLLTKIINKYSINGYNLNNILRVY